MVFARRRGTSGRELKRSETFRWLAKTSMDERGKAMRGESEGQKHLAAKAGRVSRQV